MNTLRPYVRTVLLLTASAFCTEAATFTSDFNTGLPPNTAVFGNAVVEGSGGVGDSGALKLTKSINGQSGSFLIQNIDGGAPFFGFDVTYMVRIGGGSATPADGMSLSVGPDLPDGTWGEEGVGSGLSFCWDVYDNGNENPLAPSIDVKVGGTTIATRKQTIASITTPGVTLVPVHIRVNADGSLNFDFNGVNLFTNFFIPQYQAIVDSGATTISRFGFGARTGGLNANQWVDNLTITTLLTPLVGISQQPYSQKVLQGDNAIFEVRVGNTNGVTYQWLSNAVPIPGATSQTLVIPSVTPSASAVYSVQAIGPNNTATSTNAILAVVNLTLPSPEVSYDFNGVNPPAGTTPSGTALFETTGGVGDSGVLKLTQAANGQFGALTGADSDSGAPVFGLTVRLAGLVGGGTTPPADGFAIAFGNDIPADPTATVPQFEEGQGLGTGLVVNFDVYNNDGIYGLSNPFEAQPAPSVDVRYGGQLVGSVHLPLSFMETGTNYGDFIVQLNTDGSANVVYNGALVFDHLPVPAFGSIAGGSVVVAGRTGGLNENFWVDNLQITTDTTPGALRITQQPAAQTVLVTRPATFSLGVNDTAGVTYQWFRNSTAISGATDSSYTIPAAIVGDSGALFKAQATKGPTTVTSAEVALTVLNLTAPATPTVTYNFNDGLIPTGTSNYGNAAVTLNGGVGDSGVLHITDAVNGQQGAFVISNLLNGAQISAISVAFDVLLGGGTTPPADGYSFNWAANVSDGVGGNEGGNGNGLSLCVDFFGGLNDNPPAPYIGIRYKGALVASTQLPLDQIVTDTSYRTMLLRVDSTGKLDLAYGDRVLYVGLQLPNYTFTFGKFGLYGRTGGLNENQWFDNIRIQATQSSGPLAVVTQPANATVITGRSATFGVGLSDPNGATYQWSKNGSPISGATASSYTTPPAVLGDNGALFRVAATGPSGSATSSNAVLTVVPAITIVNPSVIYDFNDGLIPMDTFVNGANGGGYIDGSGGGVTNSGVLHLTDAVNSQGGSFIFPDAANGQSVKAFTAYFAARVGGGTVPPADGFSFVWSATNDLPSNVVFGEDGSGSGLTVSFDIYNNAGEAPSFSILYHGVTVVTKLVPISDLETGDSYADVYVRVNMNATCDVQYNGQAIFNKVPLPGFIPISGGAFGLGGRTGGLNENQWIDNVAIAPIIQLALGYSFSGGNLTLTWGPGLKLQSTSSLAPPIIWADVLGATSPYTVPTTGPNTFYKLAPAP